MSSGVDKQGFAALWWSNQHTTNTPNVLRRRMWSSMFVCLYVCMSSVFVMVNPPLIIWVILSFLQRLRVGVSSLGPFPSCVLQLSWQTKINNDYAVYIHSLYYLSGKY